MLRHLGVFFNDYLAWISLSESTPTREELSALNVPQNLLKKNPKSVFLKYKSGNQRCQKRIFNQKVPTCDSLEIETIISN